MTYIQRPQRLVFDSIFAWAKGSQPTLYEPGNPTRRSGMGMVVCRSVGQSAPAWIFPSARFLCQTSTQDSDSGIKTTFLRQSSAYAERCSSRDLLVPARTASPNLRGLIPSGLQILNLKAGFMQPPV
jgi:hypothetical protein